MPADRPPRHDQPQQPDQTDRPDTDDHRAHLPFADETRHWRDLEISPSSSAWDQPGTADHPERPGTDHIRITPERLTHILDGDEHGGGHRHGTGIPGKCEFPREWDDDQIAAAILHTAARPQYVRQKPSGGWEVSRMHDDVTVWAVVRNDGRVWTAYPDPSSPSVTKNPHPRRRNR